MANVTKINHVAIVVSDIESALGFWQEGLGLDLSHIESVPSQNAEVAFIPVGESSLELVRPTAEGTGLAKFLETRGGGMHHLCVEVDDIEGMIARLLDKGVRMINEAPLELEGRRMAFVHPRSASGVLVELYELTEAT